MRKINEIWASLENDGTVVNSLAIRRYSGNVLPDLFVAVCGPERVRSIAISIKNNRGVNLSIHDDLKDMELEIIVDPIKAGKSLLLLKLTNTRHIDIFSVLAEDLIESIAYHTDENVILRTLFNRLEKWKALFEKASSEGLTPEEQRGLYGELFFLRKFLLHESESLNVVNSWLGPNREVRDFQFSNWAVEVKSSKGNNHQKLTISSERQLDTSTLEHLFLYHLSLEAMNSSGETLVNIVDSIYQLLQNNMTALNKFENKLVEGGFFNSQRILYQDTGYSIRQERFYNVQGDFPRIEECDIRSGIGDIKYSIILSNCSSYILTEQEVFQTISFYE